MLLAALQTQAFFRARYATSRLVLPGPGSYPPSLSLSLPPTLPLSLRLPSSVLACSFSRCAPVFICKNSCQLPIPRYHPCAVRECSERAGNIPALDGNIPGERGIFPERPGISPPGGNVPGGTGTLVRLQRSRPRRNIVPRREHSQPGREGYHESARLKNPSGRYNVQQLTIVARSTNNTAVVSAWS